MKERRRGCEEAFAHEIDGQSQHSQVRGEKREVE
jgi:hypothetical protein